MPNKYEGADAPSYLSHKLSYYFIAFATSATSSTSRLL